MSGCLNNTENLRSNEKLNAFNDFNKMSNNS